MSKHYIYEIFGKKIGATNDVERLMKEQKVKEGEYRIIEEHSNAKICSLRERELQKEFGYPVDRIEYWKTLRWQKKSYTPEARKKAVANTDWKARTANTDYKAKVANTDYQAFQAQRVANTDWVKKVANVDYVKRTANTDYVKRTANTDYSFHKNNKPPQSCYTPEAIAKRVANTDYSFAKNNKPPQSCYTPEARKKAVANTDYKASRAKIKKPINQYDLQGNFIKRWDSAMDAYKELGLKCNSIGKCCRGKQETSNKFVWEYAG